MPAHENSLSGMPKLIFECHICGFTGKTSGFPVSCPKCHFDPIAIENKQLEEQHSGVE